MNYLVCAPLAGTPYPRNDLTGEQIQREGGHRDSIRIKHWPFLLWLRTLGNHAFPGLRWTKTPHSRVTVDQVALSESSEPAKTGFEALLGPISAILFQSYVGANMPDYIPPPPAYVPTRATQLLAQPPETWDTLRLDDLLIDTAFILAYDLQLPPDRRAALAGALRSRGRRFTTPD